MPSRQPARRRRYGAALLFWSGRRCGRLLHRGLGGCRLRCRRCCSGLCDRDVVNLHRAIRPVVGVAAHAGNLFHQSDGGFVALAEDGVSAIQVRVGNFGDEELGAVSVRAGVGVSQASGPIKLQSRGSFVLELETNLPASACLPDRHPES